MKEKLKMVGYVFLIMIGIASVLNACGDGEKTAEDYDKELTEQVEQMKEQDTKKEVEEVKAEETEEAKVKKERKFNDEQRQLAEEILLASFQDKVHMADVTFDRDTKAYGFTPATPQFILDISMLATGELDISHWNSLVDQLVLLSTTLQGELGDGYKIVFNNPYNEENMLLIVMDGKVYYDAFNE